MERLRTPKACAALVVIAWLAALVSFWGFDAAGRRAIGDGASCSVADLQNRGIRLEMASEPGEALAVLNGDPRKAACIRRGVIEVVRYADSFFLVCYSLLALALFLLVRTLSPGRPARQRSLLVLGVLLALAMAAGDLVENRHLIDVIRLAGEAAPDPGAIGSRLPGLKAAAYVKMGALALSTAVLGALWPSRSRRVLLLRLLGFAAAALFVLAMLQDQGLVGTPSLPGRQIADWEMAGLGMLVFSLFALAALIQAVAVAVAAGPGLPPASQPVQAQGGPKP